jgi:hypothetical protein
MAREFTKAARVVVTLGVALVPGLVSAGCGGSSNIPNASRSSGVSQVSVTAWLRESTTKGEAASVQRRCGELDGVEAAVLQPGGRVVAGPQSGEHAAYRLRLDMTSGATSRDVERAESCLDTAKVVVDWREPI